MARQKTREGGEAVAAAPVALTNQGGDKLSISRSESVCVGLTDVRCDDDDEWVRRNILLRWHYVQIYRFNLFEFIILIESTRTSV